MGLDVITNCLNGDACLPGQNRMNIILILKKSTRSVADLRPISLSNVVDRVICKADFDKIGFCGSLGS